MQEEEIIINGIKVTDFSEEIVTYPLEIKLIKGSHDYIMMETLLANRDKYKLSISVKKI